MSTSTDIRGAITGPHGAAGGAIEPLLAAAVEHLAGRGIVALSGAGISTDSGIPDYRGPNSPARTPITYQQFVGDPAFRRHYWARNHLGWRHVHRTRPNAGHLALARLESSGALRGLITQNVDLLHQRAGSRTVIDLHGTYANVVCLGCAHRTTRAELAMRLERLNAGFADSVTEIKDVEIAPDADAVIASSTGFRVADCRRCGGILKPDIVYFGENVPKARVAAAYAMVDTAQALLVVGSSLTVMSGFRFVRHAVKAGTPVVILNQGATRGDELATVKIDAGCSPVLTYLADILAPTAA
jgi:NAD-dependent SIR2 family protein deacetylase